MTTPVEEPCGHVFVVATASVPVEQVREACERGDRLEPPSEFTDVFIEHGCESLSAWMDALPAGTYIEIIRDGHFWFAGAAID